MYRTDGRAPFVDVIDNDYIMVMENGSVVRIWPLAADQGQWRFGSMVMDLENVRNAIFRSKE
jgi:hypothetical protein